MAEPAGPGRGIPCAALPLAPRPHLLQRLQERGGRVVLHLGHRQPLPQEGEEALQEGEEVLCSGRKGVRAAEVPGRCAARCCGVRELGWRAGACLRERQQRPEDAAGAPLSRPRVAGCPTCAANVAWHCLPQHIIWEHGVGQPALRGRGGGQAKTGRCALQQQLLPCAGLLLCICRARRPSLPNLLHASCWLVHMPAPAASRAAPAPALPCAPGGGTRGAAPTCVSSSSTAPCACSPDSRRWYSARSRPASVSLTRSISRRSVPMLRPAESSVCCRRLTAWGRGGNTGRAGQPTAAWQCLAVCKGPHQMRGWDTS